MEQSMSQDIVQSLINCVAVTGGLFVLWSLVGRMKMQPAATRFGYALMAGVISSVVLFVVRQMI